MVFEKGMKRSSLHSSHAVSSIAVTTPDTGKGVGGAAEIAPRVKQVSAFAPRFFGMPDVWCQPPAVSWRLSARLPPSVHPARHRVTDRGPRLTRVAALLVLCAGKWKMNGCLSKTSKPNWVIKIPCQTRHHCEARKANPCMLMRCYSTDYSVIGYYELSCVEL